MEKSSFENHFDWVRKPRLIWACSNVPDKELASAAKEIGKSFVRLRDIYVDMWRSINKMEERSLDECTPDAFLDYGFLQSFTETLRDPDTFRAATKFADYILIDENFFPLCFEPKLSSSVIWIVSSTKQKTEAMQTERLVSRWRPGQTKVIQIGNGSLDHKQWL